MPFAVVAMLTVGVFTMNASEKTGNAVEIEKVEPVKAENPYAGYIYIRTLDPGSSNYIYTKVGDIEEGECTLDTTPKRCTTIVEGMNHELWGQDQFGNYSELYQEQDL